VTAPESMLVEVAIVMTNDFPVLGCPIPRGNNFLYAPVVNHAEA
jgi:hypothetical protein